MARSTALIKQYMTVSFMSQSIIKSIYGFVDGAVFENEFSKVSLESLIFDIVAVAIFLFEKILDQHKTEIDAAIYEQKSGTARWYRNMALAFQYGFDLTVDTDKFDNLGFTQDQIDDSKIIKYCSVKESLESNRLTVKVAGESGDLLVPLEGDAQASFEEYLKEIKYAGVKIVVVNNPADQLQLDMAIYRDPLVLDENGTSILLGTNPVELAVKSYMKALPFNGELVLNDLIEKLRAVDGVNNAHIVNATSSYYDTVTADYGNYAPINVKTIPVSGYFEIMNFDTVSYVV